MPDTTGIDRVDQQVVKSAAPSKGTPQASRSIEGVVASAPSSSERLLTSFRFFTFALPRSPSRLAWSTTARIER